MYIYTHIYIYIYIYIYVLFTMYTYVEYTIGINNTTLYEKCTWSILQITLQRKLDRPND